MLLHNIMIMSRLISLLVIPMAITIITGCGAGGGGVGDTNYGSYVEDNKLSLQKISDSAADSARPVIAANSNGAVYIAWEEATGGLNKELYLAYSVNSGDKFFPINGVNRTLCNTATPVSEDISLKTDDEGALYLAWVDKWPDMSRVMFFSDLSSSCRMVSDPSLKAAHSPHFDLHGNGEVSMVWTGAESGKKEMYYSRSANGGGTFSTPSNISETPVSDSNEPLLAVEGSYHVLRAVWVEGEEGSRSVVSSNFSDWLGDFLSLEPVSVTSTDSNCPAMASSFSGTYIAYKGDHSIHLSLWDIISISFTEPVVLSPGSHSPSCPQIAAGSDGGVYVVWSDKESIWLTASNDGGVTFTLPKDISSSAGASSSPRIAAFGSNISVVWEGDKGGTNEIFLSASTDNGKTFSDPKNLSNSPTPSSSPVIATDSKKFIYVAWEEGAEGSREIYFLKYALGD